jgi:nitrate reductase NapE
VFPGAHPSERQVPGFVPSNAPRTAHSDKLRPIRGTMETRHGTSTQSAAEMADEVSGSAVRRREIQAFIILAIVIWPILAVAIVGGYGFVVWMSQIIFGPPGPPPV